jgi:hypothetical protein
MLRASKTDPVTALGCSSLSTEAQTHDCRHEAADAAAIPSGENSARPGEQLPGPSEHKPSHEVAAADEGHGHPTPQLLRDVSVIGDRDEKNACPRVATHSKSMQIEAAHEPARHAYANADPEAYAHGDATPFERSCDQEHQKLVVSRADPAVHR